MGVDFEIKKKRIPAHRVDSDTFTIQNFSDWPKQSKVKATQL